MNSIRRAITSERKRILKLIPTTIAQQQHHTSFSTTTTRTPTRTFKSSKPKPPEVKSQPPSPPTTSSASNDAVLKEPVNWPKPSEIPWQAKVVNSVNLIGRVKIPVQFVASSDGTKWAGTIISQEDASQSSNSNSLPSFWIPVIFEGDLAYTAMCHLKEKDHVHVAGHLSVDVPPFKLTEVQANVQVMAHSINFVQDSQSKKISTPAENKWSTKNLGLKEESYIQLFDDVESSPVYKPKEVTHLYSDRKADKPNALSSWRDLLTNSQLWIDNREYKRKGLVKPNYPDFKRKDTGVALWLDRAPPEVLQGLARLNFSGLPTQAQAQKVPFSADAGRMGSQQSKNHRDGDSWKDLVENPNKWWDNRLDKKNQKAPDFKNKDSGKALWLGSAPAWAISSLPPVKAKTVNVDTIKAWAS